MGLWVGSSPVSFSLAGKNPPCHLIQPVTVSVATSVGTDTQDLFPVVLIFIYFPCFSFFPLQLQATKNKKSQVHVCVYFSSFYVLSFSLFVCSLNEMSGNGITIGCVAKWENYNALIGGRPCFAFSCVSERYLLFLGHSSLRGFTS